MKEILVFGRQGQLATALRKLSWPQGWRPVFLGRDAVDLTEPQAAGEAIERHKPDLVINAAAYTAVDKAESEFETARTVNALAPEAMARESAALGVPFVTISSDYVFDGTHRGAYRETDPVAPLGAYGASKEEGERLVRAANPRHLILRTSWVFSPWSHNFVRTMLRLGAERSLVRVVGDQTGKPTSAADLAAALVAASAALFSGQGRFGTYHAANDGITSWHGFATAIFAGARARGAKVPETLEAIATSDYPAPARRPANSVLATDQLATDFGIVLRPWQKALDDVLDEILEA